MLVLTRNINDQIVIGENIVITLVDIRGDKARIGIEAPPEVPVHRQEVYEAIRRHNRMQAEGGGIPSLANRRPGGQGGAR